MERNHDRNQQHIKAAMQTKEREKESAAASPSFGGGEERNWKDTNANNSVKRETIGLRREPKGAQNLNGFEKIYRNREERLQGGKTALTSQPEKRQKEKAPAVGKDRSHEKKEKG